MLTESSHNIEAGIDVYFSTVQCHKCKATIQRQSEKIDGCKQKYIQRNSQEGVQKGRK
jgi:hypothetical protein